MSRRRKSPASIRGTGSSPRTKSSATRGRPKTSGGSKDDTSWRKYAGEPFFFSWRVIASRAKGAADGDSGLLKHWHEFKQRSVHQQMLDHHLEQLAESKLSKSASSKHLRELLNILEDDDDEDSQLVYVNYVLFALVQINDIYPVEFLESDLCRELYATLDTGQILHTCDFVVKRGMKLSLNNGDYSEVVKQQPRAKTLEQLLSIHPLKLLTAEEKIQVSDMIFAAVGIGDAQSVAIIAKATARTGFHYDLSNHTFGRRVNSRLEYSIHNIGVYEHAFKRRIVKAVDAMYAGFPVSVAADLFVQIAKWYTETDSALKLKCMKIYVERYFEVANSRIHSDKAKAHAEHVDAALRAAKLLEKEDSSLVVEIASNLL